MNNNLKANLLRQRSKRERRIEEITLDWVFIGEGYEQGVAYAHSIAHPQEKLAIVDPQRPHYQLPANIQYFGIGALQYLENRPAESIKNVRDDFAYVHITFDVTRAKSQGEIISELKASLAMGKPISRAFDVERNTLRYFKRVYHVLTPGGNFFLTTSSHDSIRITESQLEKAGFVTEICQLSSQTVMQSESPQAKDDLAEGYDIIRIIGTKRE